MPAVLALSVCFGCAGTTGTVVDDAGAEAEPDAGPSANEPDAGPSANEPDAGPSVNEPDAGPSANEPDAGPDAVELVGEAWADNWFAMSIGETLVVEDSVPITTERSFNAETFQFQAQFPFVLSFVLKDFKENDSGLEYIGEPNQQMGDGGFIFQLKTADGGDVVAVSSADWKCLVIHKAPLNRECERDANPEQTCTFSSEEEPAGWKDADFDDSAWPSATEHTAAAVSPKDGYDEITWDASAKLIWGADLEIDNTILCRTLVSAP